MIIDNVNKNYVNVKNLLNVVNDDFELQLNLNWQRDYYSMVNIQNEHHRFQAKRKSLSTSNYSFEVTYEKESRDIINAPIHSMRQSNAHQLSSSFFPPRKKQKKRRRKDVKEFPLLGFFLLLLLLSSSVGFAFFFLRILYL